MIYGLLAILLWSSSFVGIRYALVFFSPENIAAYRFLFASLLFLFSRRKMTKPRRGDCFYILFLSLFGLVCYNVLLNYAESFISAATASFIISQTPLFCTLWAWIWLNEKAGKKTALGYALSIFGISLILGRPTTFSFGEWAILLAALLKSVYFVGQKRLISRHTPFEIVGYCHITAALLFVCIEPRSFILHDFHGLWILVYLAVFPSFLAHSLWAKALSYGPIHQVTGLLFLLPLSSVVLSWILLHETMSWFMLFGGCLTLAGSYCIQQGKRPLKIRLKT